MTALELPQSLHLQAADGWVGLGDYAAANVELEQMAAANRAQPWNKAEDPLLVGFQETDGAL